MTQKIACISLNLDSIGHAVGKSPLENDPTFNVVFKRIESIVDKYNIKISIFVIGKDLENKKNLNYVKEWFNKGHEIGNHTYTHPINFGYLDKKQIYEEIKKTDDLIFKASSRIGYTGAFGDSEIPPYYENFYAGGPYSVKGYEANSLGPRITPVPCYGYISAEDYCPPLIDNNYDGEPDTPYYNQYDLI